MKKSVLFIAIAAFLLTSCGPKKGGRDPKNPNEVILNYEGNEVNWTTNKVLKDMHRRYVDDARQEIKELQGGLKNQDQKQIDSLTKAVDQYIDFDLESIKALVWEMESAANKIYKDSKKPKMGIRVHYTKYPNADELKGTERLSDLDPSLALRKTIVLSPIFENEGKMSKFDPRADKAKEKKEGLPKTFTPFVWNQLTESIGMIRPVRNPRMMMMMYYFNNPGDGTNLNHGTLCPKYCPDEEL